MGKQVNLTFFRTVAWGESELCVSDPALKKMSLMPVCQDVNLSDKVMYLPDLSSRVSTVC